MKVSKNKGINALIDSLDDIFDNESIQDIQHELHALEDEADISKEKVELIFRNWADFDPNARDPRKIVKTICYIIKLNMFKEN